MGAEGARSVIRVHDGRLICDPNAEMVERIVVQLIAVGGEQHEI